MDIFTSEQLQTLLVVAIITSFIVSAFNQLQAKLSSNWLLAIVAFVVTLLKTSFLPGMSFADWQALLTGFLLTMAFSVLFWNYVGRFIIDPFFAWLKKKLLDKFNPPGSPNG